MKNDTIDYSVKADISRYYYDIDLDAPKDLVEGVVGFVSNYSNPDILIRIVLDDEYTTQRFHQGNAVFQARSGYPHECRIYLSRQFYDSLNTKPYLFSIIWHEIGHFHTLQHFYDVPQNRYYKSSKVDPKELAADYFSLLYEEKNDVLEAFRYLIRERNKKNDGNMQAAINELRNRREALRNIDVSDIIKQIEALYER